MLSRPIRGFKCYSAQRFDFHHFRRSRVQYKSLGSTEIKVSEFALGCWPFAGGKVWGPQDDDVSIATVHAALDKGITFFDTAEGYNDDSHSEDVLGRALVSRRADAVIATKISPPHLVPESVDETCDASLQRLQTDYIDLYQIHWSNHAVAIEDSMAALFKLRDAGKIRSIGVCNFGVQDLTAVLAKDGIVTNQLPYNLLWRPIEVEIAPKCLDNSVGLICYSPLAQGLLTGRYASPDEVPDGLSRSRLFSNDRPLSNHGEEGCETEAFDAITEVAKIADGLGEHPAKVSLAWVRSRPGITSLLVGARSPDELGLNIPAFEYDLPEGVADQLSTATEPVKAKLGSNADMWNGDNRMR
ncbi:MAG: aldo/keto reductase [Chloroflexi bacterium]|jgi:aryl-alcohol dehydrogenase-like predicted oxidoreductase|nr:aldo/keto reductase [Chloroflexota bacterium]|tara:strand:- start:36 stop:1106 length:1071 start_codon:yes stop_codon:yes gene_type:complete